MPTAPEPSDSLPDNALVLALDAASPIVSVAVGRGGSALAVRSVELRKSSERLLGLIDEVLSEAGAGVRDVAAMVALAGPGSFTGLRVGLATVLGCHQAIGVRAAAVPTLPVLALSSELETGTVWAVVDAIRGEWFAQPFRLAPGEAPEALAEPRLLASDELLAEAPETLVGFGLGRLPGEAGRRIVPAELASAALRLVALSPPIWDAAGLTRPLYLRAPEVSEPRPRPPIGAGTSSGVTP
ncbi:MAG: tRNA (adenosine(37)-N6)-threonylcarbamoyltransferase complex dimerization subunit type 1 TsaB [Thermoanaerobaculia bacterium]|nr:tRNA (adenosine(37)-N6)-threonylcarbamoyltransferase complex dimerization subunit type 1 TsaB [Thermoanaerobaculia bacterium]